jgi:molybdopterin-guanine dinucleotide biosynthesis protein A
MGGIDKALARLAGRPLLQHVIDRVAPQVGALVLSVESVRPELAHFGLPQLADPLPGHQGPLGGLLAAARHFAGSTRWLLLVPCDAPFLPGDLAARLQRCADEAGAQAAVVVSEGELQPTFSLWDPALLPVLEPAAGSGHQGGFKPFLQEVGAVHCAWTQVSAPGAAAAPPPFFNVNDPADLERARRWLTGGTGEAAAC